MPGREGRDGALDGLERWVRDVVTAPADPDGAEAGRVLAPLPGLPPAEQLRIYRDGWFSRLRSALAEDFPGLEHALGHHGFDHLCADYLRAHPSSYTDICRVGVDMERFVRSRTDLADVGFLADLARLEWSVTSVFDRADGPVLRVADLEGTDTETLAAARFPLASTTDLLDLGYPVHEYLEAVLAEGSPAVPAPRPCTVVVSRAGTAMSRMEVAGPLVPVLRALAEGASLEEAVGTAAECAEDDAALEALAVAMRDGFARWVGAGVFAPTG